MAYGYYGRRPRSSNNAKMWIISVGGVVLVAGVWIWVASGGDDPDALAVCMNPETNERVSDDFCGDYGDDGGATYIGGYQYRVYDTRTYKGNIPAVGQKMPRGNITGYNRTFKKSDGIVAQKVQPQGGKVSTIQRGGFGVSSGVKAGTSGGS